MVILRDVLPERRREPHLVEVETAETVMLFLLLLKPRCHFIIRNRTERTLILDLLQPPVIVLRDSLSERRGEPHLVEVETAETIVQDSRHLAHTVIVPPAFNVSHMAHLVANVEVEGLAVRHHVSFSVHHVDSLPWVALGVNYFFSCVFSGG